MGAPIKVWHTDYENYDISYSCSEHLGGRVKYETFAVAARTPTISAEALEAVKKVVRERLHQYDLDHADGLYWNKQNGWCQYDWHFDSAAVPQDQSAFLQN